MSSSIGVSIDGTAGATADVSNGISAEVSTGALLIEAATLRRQLADCEAQLAASNLRCEQRAATALQLALKLSMRRSMAAARAASGQAADNEVAGGQEEGSRQRVDDEAVAVAVRAAEAAVEDRYERRLAVEREKRLAAVRVAEEASRRQIVAAEEAATRAQMLQQERESAHAAEMDEALAEMDVLHRQRESAVADAVASDRRAAGAESKLAAVESELAQVRDGAVAGRVREEGAQAVAAGRSSGDVVGSQREVAVEEEASEVLAIQGAQALQRGATQEATREVMREVMREAQRQQEAQQQQEREQQREAARAVLTSRLEERERWVDECEAALYVRADTLEAREIAIDMAVSELATAWQTVHRRKAKLDATEAEAEAERAAVEAERAAVEAERAAVQAERAAVGKQEASRQQLVSGQLQTEQVAATALASAELERARKAAADAEKSVWRPWVDGSQTSPFAVPPSAMTPPVTPPVAQPVTPPVTMPPPPAQATLSTPLQHADEGKMRSPASGDENHALPMSHRRRPLTSAPRTVHAGDASPPSADSFSYAPTSPNFYRVSRRP